MRATGQGGSVEMRIRQVKPAFWTDPTVAKASYPARLFYIGLWCVADDAGYLDWDIPQLGAILFPHEAPRLREKHMERWAEELTGLGRLVVMACGCAVIPTLPEHQRIAGKQSFVARDKHQSRHGSDSPLPIATSGYPRSVAEIGYPPLTDSPGNGSGNGYGSGSVIGSTTPSGVEGRARGLAVVDAGKGH